MIQASAVIPWSAIGTLIAVGVSLVAVAVAWGRRGQAAETQAQQHKELKDAMAEQRTEFHRAIEEVRSEHKVFVTNTSNMISTMSQSIGLLNAALTGFGGPGTGALAKLDKVSTRVHWIKSKVQILLVERGLKADLEEPDEDEA